MSRGTAGRCTVCGVLLLCALQWGCASHRAQPEQPASRGSTVVNPPRGDRGNPPFYEVLGKRYYVRDSSDGYLETGVASWYGRDFHGLATSSGETYDMHAMTAAHTTLPIPTWVEVTNLSNGKRVIVKVNDRGPFVADRIIDLSYAAAQALDMVRAGTTRVEVRALGAPAGDARAVHARAENPGAGLAATGGSVVDAVMSPAVAAPVAAGDRPFRRMFVQVGAFSERDNAVEFVARLKANGFVNAFVVSDGDGRRALHRVRLGPLSDVQELDRVSGRLRAVGVDDTHLVVER